MTGERPATAIGGSARDPLRVLYVMGTGFTGSTLLAFLLNAHPEIATVGEATGPIGRFADQRTYRCSCDASLEECVFWRRVGQEMKVRGFDFGPNRWDLRFVLTRNRVAHQLLTQSLRNNVLDAIRDAAVLRVPPWRRRLRELARRNEAFVASVLAVTGRRVFLDASKDAVRARCFHRLTDVDLRVLHLVRDAPGFVSSHVKNRSASLDAGIRYWNRTAGHAGRLAALLPSDRFLRVRYEDLCTATEDELARIARFAGLEPRPGPIDFRATEHHIIGNRMRMVSSSEVVLDERWRERLDESQLGVIARRTGRQRRRLGYA